MATARGALICCADESGAYNKSKLIHALQRLPALLDRAPVILI